MKVGLRETLRSDQIPLDIIELRGASGRGFRLRKMTAASGRGATEGRVIHRCCVREPQTGVGAQEFLILERQQHVEHLLAVTRLLHVGDLAAAAIGDARLRDL